jgi:hypothetical protein
MATSKANLAPAHSVLLFNSLLLSLDQGLVLTSRFHLLCIIVPYDIDLSFCDFNLFYDEYQQLTDGEKGLLSKWGITEERIITSISSSIRLVCLEITYKNRLLLAARRSISTDLYSLYVKASMVYRSKHVEYCRKV